MLLTNSTRLHVSFIIIKPTVSVRKFPRYILLEECDDLLSDFVIACSEVLVAGRRVSL